MNSFFPDGACPALGPAEGWALAPVVNWLFREGRLYQDTALFIDALSERLLAVGAPVWRLYFGFPTLHPQVFAWTFVWTRERGPTRLRRAQHGVRDSDAYIGSPVERMVETRQPVRYRLDRLDAEQSHNALLEIAAEGGIDYYGNPVRFSDGSINFFVITTDRRTGFTEADVAKLALLADYLAPIFEVMASRRVATALLDTYVGHRTGERILQGLIRRGDSEVIKAALWFNDLRDFTPLSETLPAARLLAMLNAYFEAVTAAVSACGGEVLRFIGDAMLIVFPVEGRVDMHSACRAALDAALDALASVEALNHRRRRAGEPVIRFGIGLHVGEVTYGNVGAPERLDFTVIGPAVNLTARLQDLTKVVGAPVVLSAEFAACCDRPLRALGAQRLKGVAELQTVYTLQTQ